MVIGKPLSSQYRRPPSSRLTFRQPNSLSCQYAHAANQSLLSPYNTMCVSGPMPDALSSFDSSSRDARSRLTLSLSCVVQSQATAPGRCDWS